MSIIRMGGRALQGVQDKLLVAYLRKVTTIQDKIFSRVLEGDQNGGCNQKDV